MYVLDSSVLIGMAKQEPGAENFLRFVDGALFSTVNYSETLQKVAQHSISVPDARALIYEMNVHVVPYDSDAAAATAALWPLTRHKGLSLADRACLALAQAMNAVAVTTDRAWADLDLPGLEVHVVSR